ncbi:MAG TPA: GH3 auxin-responsive promoter family protein [Gemmatales bacterium]|nr:GH3 auxin-responsive promoter family protein [Gemmatales bacterium]
MRWADLIERVSGTRVVRRSADRFFHAYARRRAAEVEQAPLAHTQERQLLRLILKAQSTRFGREHDFRRIRSVADYRRLVPLRSYEDFWRDYWQPVFPRVAGATWPERIPYHALSSGTTSGSTKYIPISRDMLLSNRQAALTMLSLYALAYPQATLFSGRVFFLGGSTALTPLDDGSLAGDLSAIAAIEVQPWLRPYTFPPLSLAHETDWEAKLDELARASLTLPITLLSGVPSWLLLLFQRLKQLAGKATLAEVWPTLQLIVHGGIKFEPYRDLFRREVGSDRVRFLESYPASEGFIAFEDPRYDLLRPIPDHGLFYEFVPVAELDQPHPTRHGLHEVEVDVQYAVVVTTCAGLWSYIVGDTVAFERRDPPLLRFTGRTKYFLSAFGEHLISEEVEQAVTAAARACQADVVDFHVGPVFPEQAADVGRHRFLVEFQTPPRSLAEFAAALDAALSRINDDYRAHRQGNTSLLAPEVRLVRPHGFAVWMRAQGKLGGQHKLPRMDNSGQQTASLTTWLESAGLLQ